MVRRFTTVPAIFSRDIFTITRPETNGDACSGDRLTTGAGWEEGRGGGEYVEAVLVAGRKKFETSGGGGKNNRG